MPEDGWATKPFKVTFDDKTSMSVYASSADLARERVEKFLKKHAGRGVPKEVTSVTYEEEEKE